MRRIAARILAVLALASLAACGGGGAPPPPGLHSFPAGISNVALRTVDESLGGPCSVSVDGFVWYALPTGGVPPIDFAHANCAHPASLDANVAPQLPAWSRPAGPTKALFVATSLQEAYSLAGMQLIEGLAEAAKIPVTWMVGNPSYLAQAAYYNRLHAANGDDVELEDNSSLYTLARDDLPWYAPAVSIEGAGHERHIASALALGNGGFWGITWNSHGTDNTSDEGAPWGTYCADVSSYKRPSPSGDCTLLAFEWTARDLTRAYFGNTGAQGYSAEAAFSTDPDDVLLRAGFDSNSGATYVREIVDAYAAAGVSQPLVVVSQQESAEEAEHAAGDGVVLGALYDEAVVDGMQALTMREALGAAKAFSAAPRAIAFPYIGGGIVTAYNGVPFTPATIDYHDDAAGMTFVSGHTLPARLFEYAQDPLSLFNRALVETTPASATYPQLTGVSLAHGSLSFSFDAPAAIRFGVAIWSDPAALLLTGASVVPAGHAGAVIAFDLPAGRSTQTVRCGSCTSTTFAYSR